MRLIKKIQQVSIYRDTEWDEYVCKYPSGSYHTGDWSDALATAHAINKQLEAAQARRQALETAQI